MVSAGQKSEMCVLYILFIGERYLYYQKHFTKKKYVYMTFQIVSPNLILTKTNLEDQVSYIFFSFVNRVFIMDSITIITAVMFDSANQNKIHIVIYKITGFLLNKLKTEY